MKISFISPTSLQSTYGDRGDFNLTLSHLIPGPYEEGIRASSLPRYVDNGLFEMGVADDPAALAQKACDLNAEYVFAPDVLLDRKGTESSLISFIERMKEANKLNGTNVKVAGIVQANNPDDFLASYAFMAQLEGVELIGLSSLSIPQSFDILVEEGRDIEATRIECLKQIEQKLVLKNSHLLGWGNGLTDIDYAQRHCPWIVSTDSSGAIWNAIQGKCIDANTLKVEGGKTPVVVDFAYNEPLTDAQKEAIEWNIGVALKVVGRL